MRKTNKKKRRLCIVILGFSVDSLLGVKYDLILVLRSQVFDYLRETLYEHALEHLEAARSEERGEEMFSYENA